MPACDNSAASLLSKKADAHRERYTPAESQGLQRWLQYRESAQQRCLSSAFQVICERPQPSAVLGKGPVTLRLYQAREQGALTYAKASINYGDTAWRYSQSARSRNGPWVQTSIPEFQISGRPVRRLRGPCSLLMSFPQAPLSIPPGTTLQANFARACVTVLDAIVGRG